MTAKGKITAANMVSGTVVRIVKESDATAALFEREPEWTAARIKRGSVLAEIVDNIPVGSGRRKIVTKFGEFVAVGHQTFILAKDGEVAEEPAPIPAPELPAERFTLTEEEIEENAAEKLALTVQRDEEMQAEKVSEDTVEWMQEREQIADETRLRLITDAKRDIEEAGRVLAELNLPAVDVEKVKFEIETARNFLTSETPWEASRHAKRTAEMWARVVRLRGEFASAEDWRKERITAALATMGTVVYPEGTPEYEEYRKSLTEALDAWKKGPERYRIVFERIGRYNAPEAFEYNSDETPESVEARLRARIAPMLTSREFGFHFEGDTLLIEGGRFGRGEVVRPE